MRNEDGEERDNQQARERQRVDREATSVQMRVACVEAISPASGG
jgi:hypothetical protein